MGRGDKTRRRRKEKQEMPKLAPAPRRKARGKRRMQQIDKEAQNVVLEARARRMGRDGADEAVRSEMRTAALGEAAGRVIHVLRPDRASDLWATYKAITGAEETYLKRRLQMRVHPKVAKIEMVPEQVESRADHKPDLRSEEDKHRDAVNRWQEWVGELRALDLGQQAALWAVIRGWAEPLDPDGKATPAGERFVDALEMLHDG